MDREKGSAAVVAGVVDSRCDSAWREGFRRERKSSQRRGERNTTKHEQRGEEELAGEGDLVVVPLVVGNGVDFVGNHHRTHCRLFNPAPVLGFPLFAEAPVAMVVATGVG